MSEINLFEMEWNKINEKSDININSLSLFQEIENELSKKLLEERVRETRQAEPSPS